jgi:hypothetical protein
VEACEHLAEGPAASVTAGAVADDTAPLVADDHKRYDIALTETAGVNSGFVRFAVDHEAEYIFFVDQQTTLEFTDAAGNAVAPSAEVTSSTECTDIKGKVTVDLGLGTYFIEVSSDAATLVGLVIEEVAHEH